MARYLISDHHFTHSNIIGYTDRPFTSVGEMNQAMMDKYYETVDTEDVLIHLGDVAMDMSSGQDIIKYFQKLNANILIQGNHDVGLKPSEAPFPVLKTCTIQHGDYTFHLSHKPEDIPENWSNWAIHGHMHNNDTENYPFIHYDEKRVNVSAELLNYTPVQLDDLTKLLDHLKPGTQIRDLEEAKKYVEKEA